MLNYRVRVLHNRYLTVFGLVSPSVIIVVRRKNQPIKIKDFKD